LVSDRATGLIKLGTSEYFDVCSMPDLFHFNQELGKNIGATIGKAWKKAKETYTQSTGYYSQRKPFEDAFLELDICRNRYQNGIHAIHKAVQPFTPEGVFTTAKIIKDAINAGIEIIEQQAQRIEKEVKDKVIAKVNNQIPDIIKWLIHYLLPVFIWELALRRIHVKQKNKKLIKAYNEILQKARDKLKGSNVEKHMGPEKYQQCLEWAEQTARTFQRSSSQVEGRNGYLAFVHKANRGLAEQRLKVLTVVHNFDIRGWDKKTPAERLFKQGFPDLFEFVLQDVTGFAEPRASKRNRLIISSVAP
jgi:Family of unknown function (DUF6399)